MSLFYQKLERFKAQLALIDAQTGQQVSYAQLAAKVAAAAAEIAKLGAPSRKLVFIEGGNSVSTVIYYLACLGAGHPVFMFDGTKPEALKNLVKIYNPHLIITPSATKPLHYRHGKAYKFNSALTLLLSTSGSTGTPKFVRLSGTNIHSNAASIAEYLGITVQDKTLAHLKLHYSYGLSVLHSHLAVGATVVLSDASVLDEAFWEAIKTHAITSFAGVPYNFTCIDKRNTDLSAYPSLRYLTQAGGKMQRPDVLRWLAKSAAVDIDFVVMYGQTEASPRIAYLPAQWAATYSEAIGVAIPGGTIELHDADGRLITQPGEEGELVYKGPNVMMGYAQNIADLARPKEVEALHTGDIASRNTDGLFTVTGRKSRFIKPFGLRISLDDVQTHLSAFLPEAVCTGTDNAIMIAYPKNQSPAAFVQSASAKYGLPVTLFKPIPFAVIPMLASGKPDYPAILKAGSSPNILPTLWKLAVLPFSLSFLRAWVLEVLAILKLSAAKPQSLEGAYCKILGLNAVDPSKNFKQLGGDSLSYVTMSLELEDRFGKAPANWESMSVAKLTELENPAGSIKGNLS